MPGLTTGLPMNPGDNYTVWEWLNVLMEMFDERYKPLGCIFFPPGGSPGFPIPTVDTIVDNSDGTLTCTFSNVNWTAGEWTGSNHTADCANSPLRYNLVIFGNMGPPADPYQQVSGYVIAQTQNTMAHTGTLTISPSATFLNAVTAKFIPNISALAGKPYALVQVGYPTYLDRRWTRPNDQEAWVGNFSPGWNATLNYNVTTGAETFSTTGSAPFFPITVFFQAVAGSSKMVGTLSLNEDGSFSGISIPYSVAAGTNTGALFDHTIWATVSFSFCKPFYDPATGIGQLQQFINLDSPSPYDNLITDPPQPPHTKFKTDLFKGMDLLAFDNAGGVGTAVPDPGTFPLSLGHDYTTVPTVTASGGGGSGVAITAVLGTSTAVVYMLLTNVGAGYLTAPTISISGSGGFAAATCTIDGSGKINSITLTISSTGFTSEPTVTIGAPPMGGTQAVARAILGVNTVVSYTVTAPGLAYVTPPTLTVSGGGGTGAVAVATLNGSTKLLIRGSVAGNDAGIIYLGKRPSDPAYTLPSAPLTLDAGQEYVVLATGLKGMPGRHGDPILRFYGGVLDQRVTHTWDDSLGFVGKMAPNVELLTLDSNDDCNFFPFAAQDIDVLYPADVCNCGKWDLPLNFDFYKNWRALQIYAVLLLENYINPGTLGLSTPPTTYTFATIMAAIGANSAGLNRTWRRRIQYLYPKTCFQEDSDVSDSGDPFLIDPPAIVPGGTLPTPAGITLVAASTGGALTHSTTFAYRVSYFNGSGETLASTEQTVTTPSTPAPDTYSIAITWPFQVGASGANVYGRTASGELLIASVSMPTTRFVDDGSITPSGALPTSNTTHNSCNGVGTWIKKPPSTNYMERDPFGYATGGASFVAGDYSRYMGDSAADPFGNGDDKITIFSPVFDRFFRGRKAKAADITRTMSRSGTVVDSTLNYIFDRGSNWWTDEVNTGTLRIQGGTASSGSGTTLVVTSISGQALCWWNTGRYINLGGVWGGFILEIYAGGSPAGWSFSADSTATYSAPSAPGHTGTSGTTPTVSAVIPGPGLTLIHVIGTVQTVYVEGNHFDPAATVTLTNTDTGDVFTPSGTVSAFGEIAVSFDFGFVAASWSVVVTNPGPHASSPFTFITHAVNYVPITSGTISSGTGTLGFSAVSGLSVSSGDGYLIREPAYELNKWQQRMVQFTKDDGSTFTIPARYSSNQRLFFDTQISPFGIGWNYAILEYSTAVVLKFSATKPTDGRRFVESIPSSVYWSEPYILNSGGKIIAGSNTDARGGGDFLLDLTANLETKVTGYGYWMAGDDFGKDIPNQIYAMLLLCKMTGNFSPACRNIPGIGATPEDNSFAFAFGGSPGPSFTPPPEPLPNSWGATSTYDQAFSGTVAQFNDLWIGDFTDNAWGGNPDPPTQDPGYVFNPPIATDFACPEYIVAIQAGTFPNQDVNGSFVPTGPFTTNRYAYLEDSGIPTCLSCTSDFWVHSIISDGDPNEGIATDWPERSVNHFDPQGTPLAYRLYVKISGGISSKGGTGIVFSEMVGNNFLLPPTFTKPADPSGHGDPGGRGEDNFTAGSSVSSGYKVDAVVAIRTWVFQYL